MTANDNVIGGSSASDKADHLEQLGSGATKYPTCPEDAKLETFENAWPDNERGSANVI